MKAALTASTIHKATICKALLDLKKAGIEKASTSEIGEVLMRPQNYDMGGRLHSLATSTHALMAKEKSASGGKNVYFITDEGESYLATNLRYVQQYGEYKLAGTDRVQSPVTSGAALQALTELQHLIESNVKVKTFINKLYYQIDDFLQEIQDGE